MLKLFLWFRYLRKKKMVFLSIAAVALSAALLIVVDSLFTGFIDAVKKVYIAEAGNILIGSWRPIPRYKILLDKLEQLEEVEAAASFAFGAGLLRLDSGDVRDVAIQGIEPNREAKFTDWKGALLRQKASSGQVSFEVPGYPNDEGAWLGVGVVAEPDEETDEYDLTEVEKFIGKQLVLTTAGFGNKRKVVKFRVSDIAFTPTYYGDKSLYLPFNRLHRLRFGDSEAEHTRNIKVKLKNKIDAKSTGAVIAEACRQFACGQLRWEPEAIAQIRVLTTEQWLNDDYFTELRKQMAVLLLIFGVISSVTVLLTFCIFYMIVETKLKDIAIIKSCGATSLSAASIFVGFGACVGAVGAAFGVILGYAVTKNINTLEQCVGTVFGLKLWRSSSYGLNIIPHQVNWPAVWPIVLAAVISCCLGALIPAIVAARTKPVNILRYE